MRSASLLLSLFPLLPAEGPVELALPAAFELELEARWEPLTDTVYGFETRPLLRELAPARPRATYGAEAFRPLLPPGPVAVGDLWRVDPVHVVRFLQQLHPGATERLHHAVAPGIAAPGAWACLRALGPRHAEIWLRAHADVVLDGDGERDSSSFLTPAQFEGRMLVDRERGVVTAFELALPDARANVDVNLVEDGGTIADIGRFPRMELRGGTAAPGAPSLGETTAEIGVEEARAALERRFYPAAEIEWLPLEEALAAARRTGRPLHVIALFGSFLDESC